jgi:hypothetical protein
MGPSFSFDATAQALVIPTPVAPLPADTVRVADDAARLNTAPTGMNQILIQTTDATNGANSLWVPLGLGVGNWALRVGSMGLQNSSTVNITGGAISGISPPLPVGSGGTGAASVPGARTNLTLPTAVPAANNLDWAVSDNFEATILNNTVWTFSNVLNGKKLFFAVRHSSAFSSSFPATVIWPAGGVPPTPSAGAVDLYEFVCINTTIYGRMTGNYMIP